jgi:hypothetical protein
VAYKAEANNCRATGMAFNGSQWVNVGKSGFSKGRANYTCLAVNNGIPYVAYGGNDFKAARMVFE